jgi:hypothetical protein
LDRRLGGLQSLSGRGGEEKNSQPPPGLEPPIAQPVAQRYNTELSQLLTLLLVALIHLLKKLRWAGHVTRARGISVENGHLKDQNLGRTAVLKDLLRYATSCLPKYLFITL